MKSSHCRSRDQDILLYIHNELPRLRRGLVGAHLRTCIECQDRAKKLTLTSRILGESVTDRPIRIAPISGGMTTVRMRFATVALALLVIAICGAVVYQTYQSYIASCAPASQSSGRNSPAK